MRKIEKKKLNKNAVSLIVLGSMLLLLVGVLVVLQLLPAVEQSKNPTTKPVEIIEELGESTYAGAPLAYVRVEQKQMQRIVVRNRDDKGELRMFDVVALSDGSFVLGYSLDGTRETLTPYLPGIIGEEPDFDLSSLYAIEQNDSYGKIYLLTYLCTALGTPHFAERIALPVIPEDVNDPTYSDKVAEREAMLERFGLDLKHASGVEFDYKDTDGEIKGHELLIGARALSGSGFYFMVDDRDYVYYTNSNYFEYALRGFEAFVNGRLVAEGLEDDYGFEPYLVSDFQHWVNTEYKNHGDVISKDASVIIADGVSALPFTAGADYTPGGEFNGYITESGKFIFSKDRLSDHSDYSRLANMLVGKTVGEYTSPLYVTLVEEFGSSASGLISVGEGESVTYTYKIKAIESVITATDEIRDSAALASAPSYKLVKVTYDYYINGEKQNKYDAHAVLDITNSLIPSDAASAIRAAGIGATDISFDVTYTEENAPSATESLYIDAITGIYDQKGTPEKEITETSLVTFVYYEVINGHKTSSRTIHIDLSANDESERWGELKAKLVGKRVGGNLDIKLYEKVFKYEIMRDFSEYRINEIISFVTSTLNVSFRYINKTEQEPFYGESIYENTMDEHGYDKYMIYGIDSTVCQNVALLLGGAGNKTNNSNTSVGYVGETVALGLTHDVMSRYGLYAHTVYFELPRHIYDPDDLVDPELDPDDGTPGDLSDLSTYKSYDNLGFTLYISEDKGGYRYVGSDMYDLVAKVPAEDFNFLDYSFTELWARQQFFYMDVTKVDGISLDFYMEDYYGSYDFDVNKQKIYVAYTSTGGIGISYEPFEGATEMERMHVRVTSSNGAKPTEYERIKAELGRDSLTLTELYNQLYKGGDDYYISYTDSYGTTYYKSFFEKFLRTSYLERNLTEEEITEAYSRNRLMHMTVTAPNLAGEVCYYGYDFYYIDGSRVMVSVYTEDASGRVTSEKTSDFAISNYAFENIVMSVFGLLNGENLDEMGGYIDK